MGRVDYTGAVVSSTLSGMKPMPAAFITSTALVLCASAADAQSLMAGAGLGVSAQRFAGAPPLNRLDGTVPGFMVTAGLERGRFGARVEASMDGVIRDTSTIDLTVNGRPLSISSSLDHDRRAVAVMGGYAHRLPSRFRLDVLAGISFGTVHRTFRTDAGAKLLTSPSQVPPAAETTALTSRFTTWIAGADLSVPVAPHVRVVAAVRGEPVMPETDLAGYAVRVLAGVMWRR